MQVKINGEGEGEKSLRGDSEAHTKLIATTNISRTSSRKERRRLGFHGSGALFRSAGHHQHRRPESLQQRQYNNRQH